MSAWYSVLSMGFGYLSAAIILVIVVISIRKTVADRRSWKKAVAGQRQLAYAGELKVLSGGSRKLAAGEILSVPYEGTVGSASGSDVVLSIRRLHLRAAFFWVEGQSMHMVPIQREAIQVDGEMLRPGDEAVMTTGARITFNGVTMELRLYETAGSETGSLSRMPDAFRPTADAAGALAAAVQSGGAGAKRKGWIRISNGNHPGGEETGNAEKKRTGLRWTQSQRGRKEACRDRSGEARFHEAGAECETGPEDGETESRRARAGAAPKDAGQRACFGI